MPRIKRNFTTTLFSFAMFLIFYGAVAYAKDKPNVDEQGLIWIEHLELGFATSELSPNIVFGPSPGVDLNVESNPANAISPFPRSRHLTAYVNAPPAGYYVNGVRLCYGILGNDVNTKVTRLRIIQFDETATDGGTIAPGYIVRLEDTSAGALAPTPSTTFDDFSAFECIDSINDTNSDTPGTPACIETDTGTLGVGVEAQVGDEDDRIYIRALALRYDLGLPDAVTCPSL